MKVGAFKIINGQKVGGNVASYFCEPDGSVVHAIAGQVQAQKFRVEARWAVDVRKSAHLSAMNLNTGRPDPLKLARYMTKAHGQRFYEEHRGGVFGGDKTTIPAAMPLVATPVAQTHWLLAAQPLAKLDTIYPKVWRQILREELSDLPVEQR